MTNWLKIFLAFYILVAQPALLGWMLNNGSLYQLAWLNAWMFIVAWLISALFKSNKSKIPQDNASKVIEKSEEKVSRIENDKGVAVVSVEKKQEVVVETTKNEESELITEWLVENNDENAEENLEKKIEDKNSEKILRENVNIPKIVQPLSWHKAPKKKEKDLKWWQWLVMLITLGVAAIIASTLMAFLWSRWIAIALFIWWILYLITGKLFDVDGFYRVGKLFTNWLYIILILVWIGYWVYAAQNSNSFHLFKDEAVSYIKDRFKSEQDGVEVDTWDMLDDVFDWTGEVISDIWDNMELGGESESLSGEVLDWNISWQDVSQSDVPDQAQLDVQVPLEVESVSENEEQIQQPVAEDLERQVTWWEALKHLLQWYTLSTKTDKTFVYVAKSNELYPYFKTAQEKAMIWFDVNPNKNISCETYMSLKWILEWWKVNIYDKSQTRNIYWNKAYELGKTNGCAKWSFVKVKNL